MRRLGPASFLALSLAACGVPAVVDPLAADSGSNENTGGAGGHEQGASDGGGFCECGAGFVCVPSTGECVAQVDAGVDEPDAGQVTCSDGDVKSCGASKLGECRLGTATCAGGTWGACTGNVDPAPEICNAKDDDCDGLIDEDQPDVACGTGQCRRMHASCINGTPTPCTPGAPSAEVCNGLDDDCDGTNDNGLPTLACGVGACARSVSACSMSMAQTCTPGLPSAEVCNGADDDCDGVSDEGLGSTTCGQGICARTVQNCVNGASQQCTPGMPQTETCNGADDDCDGAIDDGFGMLTCGTGACFRSVPACSGGMPGACTPGMAVPELCNGADDDCDGMTDEALPVLTCGVGACFRMIASCNMGTPQLCVAGMPGAEACNGMDDDCDGSTDEGLGSTTCGQGSCQRTVQNCQGGAPQMCAPGMPQTEVCNGADDDCDGSTDEGLAPITCGVGACQRTVAACTGGTPGMCTPGMGSAETCNGVDDDCDGTIDDGVCTPVVTCPANRTVNPNTTVALATTAMSPAGRPLTCQWTVVSRPTGSSGSFSAPTSCTSTNYDADVVGVHTLRFTTTDSAGVSSSCTVTVTVNAPTVGLWVELTWNRANDMDLHLQHPSGGNNHNRNGWGSNATPYDCYWLDTNPSWDAAGPADDPSLDRDDISGTGPENIRITSAVTTHDYTVGVHLFTWSSIQTVTATVRIYCSGVLRTTQTRTFNQEDEMWVVGAVRFATNGTCTFTPDGFVFDLTP